jgi:hypothetical protein
MALFYTQKIKIHRRLSMEQLFTPQFFGQAGISGLILLVAIKAIAKLYNDMRQDSKDREEKLMIHLDKVTDTLENINQRLCNVEKCVTKGE